MVAYSLAALRVTACLADRFPLGAALIRDKSASPREGFPYPQWDERAQASARADRSEWRAADHWSGVEQSGAREVEGTCMHVPPQLRRCRPVAVTPAA
ncbi:hypothetical protein E2C01_041402 [Portunus trituberculatus]|uniref:Uncharacterized protein n=1 Tax=Portunus trituberculatus TaxID=210409 RepID=A0A5B7FQV1_PORTR|nr:hypothetical protein [Portunus trituberculatus]